jgi:hypothetical protein
MHIHTQAHIGLKRIDKNLGRLGIAHANRMEKLSVLSPE